MLNSVKVSAILCGDSTEIFCIISSEFRVYTVMDSRFFNLLSS